MVSDILPQHYDLTPIDFKGYGKSMEKLSKNDDREKKGYIKILINCLEMAKFAQTEKT